MPFLLMVFLVLVCLPEPQDWLEPLWTDSPWTCVLATWLAILLTSLHAFFVARRVSGPLEGEPSLRERLLTRYERGRFHHQIAVFLVYILALLGLGWGWAVGQLWRGSATPLPGAELLILSPFVIAQLLAWAAYYDAERAAHRAAHRLLAAEPHAGAWLELERARSAPPVFGSRASYVLFQLRQKLALVFLPVLLLLIQKELQRLFPAAWQSWQKAVNFLGIAAVLIVFAAMPWIVRLVLGLKPLPAGPLRQRLEGSARRLRFRCANILVWNTRNGMANAMVIGILPWVRYVVFTDRLLEDFTPDEIEAVFGHEVGHIRHHHMLYYFTFLTASVIVLGWLIIDVVGSHTGAELRDPSDHQRTFISEFMLVTVLLAYIFVVFGFLSRRCERQADVFGCRAVSCPSPSCRGHDDEDDLSQRGRGLCPTGINTFIRALEKVALVNGISRDRPGFLQSWQHATIGRRIEFLQSMLLDPAVERRFQRRVFLLKSLLLIVLAGAVAFILVHESKAPPMVEQAEKQISHR
ncbi:MAG TPA: M48 family metallopeptidase [Gemmataceae bacterium]|nr:M48 family metallopeptidase [Gemmataceae bacterium]